MCENQVRVGVVLVVCIEYPQGKIVPKSYAQFPGKMDHSTAMCIRVGKFPKLSELRE
jgi:hypothetical protein